MNKISYDFFIGNSHSEGSRGLESLARLVSKIGYRDLGRYGQIAPDVYLGNILEFIKDNPGAIEILMDFVLDNFVEKIEKDSENEQEIDDE